MVDHLQVITINFSGEVDLDPILDIKFAIFVQVVDVS